MGAKNAAAAPPTAGVAPAAVDEISALLAAQLAVAAQIYQAASAQVLAAVSAQAAALEFLASTLSANGGSDAGIQGIDATDTCEEG